MHGWYTRGSQWVLICGVNAPHPFLSRRFQPLSLSLSLFTTACRLAAKQAGLRAYTRAPRLSPLPHREGETSYIHARIPRTHVSTDGRIQLRLRGTLPFSETPTVERARAQARIHCLTLHTPCIARLVQRPLPHRGNTPSTTVVASRVDCILWVGQGQGIATGFG